MAEKVTNYEKLKAAVKERKPFIIFDVEATGIMNGNDNHVTQLALTAYDWNPYNGRYELQDNLFMLAKALPDSLHEIEERQKPTISNAERLLKSEYVYSYRSQIQRVIQNCLNRQHTLEENYIPKTEKALEECSDRAVKKKESLTARLEEYKNRLENEKNLEQAYRRLFDYVPMEDIEKKSNEEIDAMVKALKNDELWKSDINKVILAHSENGLYRFDNEEAKDRLNETLEYYQKMISMESDRNHIEEYKGQADEVKAELESICENFSDFIEKNRDEKLNILKSYDNLDTVLESQGIDKGEWISKGLGLTNGEIQVGINEFFGKYNTKDTILATNGTKYASHYLTKDSIVIPNLNSKDTIDLIQVEKTRGNSPQNNLWSANIGDFAEIYKSETGKEIKVFDAYTKALCFAEIISRAAEIPFSNRSMNQMANAVTEKAMSMDEDYVMSASRASSLHWHIATEASFLNSDFKFHSLEYVNFGSDRRYVDLDAMFEINDNFEVTLEGEKTPIKTWEELEDKIKALNSNISEQLLDRIKEKYMEIEGKALNEAHKYWKDEYENGSLSYKDMTTDQKAYLSGIFNIEEEEPEEDYEYDDEEEDYDEGFYEPQTEDEVKAVSEPATKADSFANLLSAKIDAFDSELALLEEEDKDIKNRIRDALAVKIENIKSEIAEMLPYVSAVYERCGKRIDANVRWGGMCYDKEHKDFRLSGWGTNANPIIYTLDKGTDENANESEIGLCKNIVEDWAELKSRIMMCCEDVLYSTLEEKKKIVKEHKDKLNDFEK